MDEYEASVGQKQKASRFHSGVFSPKSRERHTDRPDAQSGKHAKTQKKKSRLAIKPAFLFLVRVCEPLKAHEQCATPRSPSSSFIHTQQRSKEIRGMLQAESADRRFPFPR